VLIRPASIKLATLTSCLMAFVFKLTAILLLLLIYLITALVFAVPARKQTACPLAGAHSVALLCLGASIVKLQADFTIFSIYQKVVTSFSFLKAVS